MNDVRTVFDLARRDHERHLEFIGRVQGETSAAGRARGAALLAADLARHTKTEETALISHLLAHPDSRTLARRTVADHQRLQRLVSDLTCHVYDEVAAAVALSTYRSAFLESVRLEEEELYPVAMLVLEAERGRRLADRWLAATPEQLDYMLAR